jgi:hypothetical protein
MSRNDNRWSESRRGTVLVICDGSAPEEMVGNRFLVRSLDELSHPR